MKKHEKKIHKKEEEVIEKIEEEQKEAEKQVFQQEIQPEHKEKLECPFCMKKYKSQVWLDKHIEKEHKNESTKIKSINIYSFLYINNGKNIEWFTKH